LEGVNNSIPLYLPFQRENLACSDVFKILKGFKNLSGLITLPAKADIQKKHTSNFVTNQLRLIWTKFSPLKRRVYFTDSMCLLIAW